MRQALAYAFDFEWSNKNLFYGQYTRTRSYFDNSELAATGLPSPAESWPSSSRIAGAFPMQCSPPSTIRRAATAPAISATICAQAVQLLGEAGWKIDEKTKKLTHAESGRVMDFEILLVQPEFERIVLPFTKNLERLGIAAAVRTVDTAQYRRRLDDFDFDMIVGNWPESLSPGNEQRNFWGSEFAARQGSQNFIGIKNPVVDELIEALIAAPDRASLVNQMRALDRVLQWDHWVIPHWHLPFDRVAYWDKFGPVRRSRPWACSSTRGGSTRPRRHW